MVQYSWKFVISRNIPVGVYLLKVNNRNTFEENKWIVDFRHISHLILVFIVNVEHVIAGWGITLLLRHFNGDISSQNVRAWLQNIKKTVNAWKILDLSDQFPDGARKQELVFSFPNVKFAYLIKAIETLEKCWLLFPKINIFKKPSFGLCQ